VRFYQRIAAESTLQVPACYHAAVDLHSGWHILLLEDLTQTRCGSRAEGCSAAEARTAIRHIARFHAHWWENPKLAEFTWLTDSSGAPDDARMAGAHREWWPVFLAKAGQDLPDELIEIGESLGERRGDIARHLLTQSPRTLVHSDFHLDNLLFGAEADSLFVVDWQFMKLGRGMSDVAFFLSQNLAPADRRAIETDLMAEYISVLSGAGVHDYGVDDALYDYRVALLHRLGSLISTIAAMPFTPEQIRLHVEVLLPRAVSAIVDHDCLSLLKGMAGAT
jgi:aminoglycoside/choline kinase family phosphotransferase